LYLVDANVVLETLYRRGRWGEAYELLNAVKRGSVGAYMLHFAIHGICALLGKPEIVAGFLSELLAWRGLVLVDLPLEEELAAAEAAVEVGLDFDDGLHYYFARRRGIPIVSFDKDFDGTGVERLEPGEALERAKQRR